MLTRKLAVLGFFVFSLSVAGCTSRPELAQVPSGAKAQPINSAESAQSLQDKYGS